MPITRFRTSATLGLVLWSGLLGYLSQQDEQDNDEPTTAVEQTDTANQPAASGAPRVKLVIPGEEPIIIDTLVSEDLVLELDADYAGVRISGDQTDLALRRGSQPGSIALSSPLGGTFEMQGQFTWKREGVDVILASVGGTLPGPLPVAAGESSDEEEAAATTPPDTNAADQGDPIKIVDEQPTSNNRSRANRPGRGNER